MEDITDNQQCVGRMARLGGLGLTKELEVAVRSLLVVNEMSTGAGTSGNLSVLTDSGGDRRGDMKPPQRAFVIMIRQSSSAEQS